MWYNWERKRLHISNYTRIYVKVNIFFRIYELIVVKGCTYGKIRVLKRNCRTH